MIVLRITAVFFLSAVAGLCGIAHAQELARTLYPIKLQGKWGYMDKRGSVIIPAKFQHVGEFSEDLASFYNEDGNGYLDAHGEIVIPPRFGAVGKFHDGMARVSVPGEESAKECFINRKGEVVKCFTGGDFSEGLAPVAVGEK